MKQKIYAVVLRVIGWDDDKSPRRFELVRDDETVDVSSGKEQFWIVYADKKMSKRNQ